MLYTLGKVQKGVRMKKLLLATTMMMLAAAIPVKADLIGDPLHGTICDASGGSCNAAEVGGVVPGNFGAGNTFGFNSSPAGATGDLWIALLVPTNELGGFDFRPSRRRRAAG